MTIIRKVAVVASLVIFLAESSIKGFYAQAKIQEDGACPLFVLLPFTSV
jgi:hypothetical protein